MAFPSTCQETHRCALALIRVSVLRKQGRQVREEMESWSRGVPPVLKNNDNDNRNLHPMHCNALGANNRRTQDLCPPGSGDELQDAGRMKMTAFAQEAHPCCSRTHVFFLTVNAECGANTAGKGREETSAGH